MLTAVLLAMRVAAALLAAAPVPVLASVTLVVGKLIMMLGITLSKTGRALTCSQVRELCCHMGMEMNPLSVGVALSPAVRGLGSSP